MRHGGSEPAHYLQSWARRQRAELSKGKRKSKRKKKKRALGVPRDEGQSGCRRSGGRNGRCYGDDGIGEGRLSLLSASLTTKWCFYFTRSNFFFFYETSDVWVHKTGQELHPKEECRQGTFMQHMKWKESIA